MATLHAAVRNKWHSRTKFLLTQQKADVNSADCPWLARTALMLAAENDDLASMRLLLQEDADTTLKDYRGRTALHFAIESKKHSAAKILIAKTADMNSVDFVWDGRTVLMIAVEKDDVNSVEMLLQAGADTTVRNKRGCTAIHIAIKSKRHSAVEVLVAEKAALNSVDNDGRTALMIAVEKDDLTSLQMLLQAGADTTLKDKRGQTALQIAIRTKSHSAAEVLIARKEALNSVDDDGRTALMIAVEKDDLTSLQMLLPAGADTTLRDKGDHTALHIAIFETKSQLAAKVLMAEKTALNLVDSDGRTALMIAVEKDDLTSLQMLLQAGADTTIRDKRGHTALHIALFETKSLPAAKVLMEKKAALNSVDGDGRTALMIAVEKVDLTSLRMLLGAGADTTLRDKRGRTALHSALFETESHSAARVLMEKEEARNSVDCGGRTVLMIAVEKIDLKSLGMLLQSGADTSIGDKAGRTALMIAAGKGDKTSMQMLWQAGADTTLTDKCGRTALHIAIESMCHSAVEFLIAKKADMNSVDGDGRSAVMIAAEKDDRHSVQMLLKANANPAQRDKRGRTALHIAIETKSHSAAEVLIAKKADVNSVDGDGRTTLMIAAKNNDPTSLRMLLEADAAATLRDKCGRTALHLAIETMSHSTAKVLIEKMKEKMVDVNPVDHEGRTALMIAAEKDDPTSLQMLLGANADATLKEKRGRTALHLAIERMCHSTATVLIEKMSDVNLVDCDGRTALMIAAEKDDRNSVQKLLGANADPSLRDKRGRTALHIAISETKSYSAAEVLMKNKTALNSVDDDDRTALMVAVGKDDLILLPKLLQAKPDTALKDKRGCTALHIAIEAKSHSAAEVLIAIKADVNSVTGDGRTALMIAVEKDDLTSLKILLKAGADCTLRDKKKRTVLHHAAECGFHNVVKLLLDKQTDADAVDEDGNTPLHIAAIKNMSTVVNVLLERKANADFVNKRSKWPYQLATDGELKRILQEARFAVLYAAGTVTPKAMKLCVIGSAGAGKTTLLEALKRGWFRSWFTWERQRDNPDCEFERTVGINVATVDIPGVGRFSLFDYAGQEQFHKTHGLFFSGANSFFILLISLLKGGQPCSFEELIAVVQYWLFFLRASLEKHFIPTVMIAASRTDSCPDGQRRLEKVVRDMRDAFKGKITIRAECFSLDCRKSWSREMQQIRGLLKEVRDQYMKSGVRYPRLCEPVTSDLLPDLREKLGQPFMETEELVSVIKREKCPGLEKEVINKVVDFLDESGEIVHVESVVSLSPGWLSEYAVGPLMAPEDMKWHARAQDGRMTRQEAERAVKQYLRDKKIKVHVNIDHILKMLVNMGLTFRLEDGTYMFPSHLPLKSLAEVWKKEKDKQVYVGRRHVCSSPTSNFSPSVFTLFQCQVSVKLDINSLLWQDGIIVARARKSPVQCLAVMVDPLRAVDFVARGKEGSELDCLSLLDDVMKEWTDMVEKHSPGTDYQMAYLSRKHLTEHKDQPAFYSKEKIEKAKIEGPSAFVMHGVELAEQLSDLLVFPPGEQCPTTKSAVVRAVLPRGRAQWYTFGLELGFTDDEISEHCHDKADDSSKLLVLLEKKANEVSLKILEGRILDVCKRLPTPIYGIVKQKCDELVAEQVHTKD